MSKEIIMDIYGKEYELANKEKIAMALMIFANIILL